MNIAMALSAPTPLLIQNDNDAYLGNVFF